MTDCHLCKRWKFPSYKWQNAIQDASSFYVNNGEKGLYSPAASTTAASLLLGSCSPSQPCPSDVPTGTTAIPQCLLETHGSLNPINCALVCGSAGDDRNSTCPPGTLRQYFQNTAICTVVEHGCCMCAGQ
jgi:hypothetical protein